MKKEMTSVSISKNTNGLLDIISNETGIKKSKIIEKLLKLYFNYENIKDLFKGV